MLKHLPIMKHLYLKKKMIATVIGFFAALLMYVYVSSVLFTATEGTLLTDLTALSLPFAIITWVGVTGLLLNILQ
jgi:YbbR domain-containing protein